ncbi:beta-lactamase/D-alanine carboxypeptidase [Shewanella mangrovi]|uniref:Beta-lactamase n=2 Tax=Shewanella mangrovi TaxID=1515746 RepID=A0A094JFE8_9GAMM|nr:beta-lactamase/D-alanine carboxypeptidase [Shewanella mangrovi]
MAIAVLHQGQQAFFTFGVASIESQTPVTAATLFELGSVSKTFNALLAGYAIDQGKFDLAAHPSEYWSALTASSLDNATLLQLGTYTAGGLPLQFPMSVTDDETMRQYFQQWQANAAPGIVRQYSNPSIALFGYLVSRALGADYKHLIQQQVLPALGLTHTYIDVPATETEHYAWGYNANMQPVHVQPDVLDAEAYGVKSSAADMLKYVALQLDSSGLPNAYQRAIALTHVGHYQLGDMRQGLGWEQYPYPLLESTLLAGNSKDVIVKPQAVTPVTEQLQGAVLFNKTGSTAGFGAYLVFVSARQLGVVILANRYYPNSARVKIATAIIKALDSDGIR